MKTITKFGSLTKYIPELKNDEFGEWIVDKENDGTPEHLKQMPYVIYSKKIHAFIDDFHQILGLNKDMGLDRYSAILEANCIKWEENSMQQVDVSNLSEQCVLALILAAIRAERFFDGTLLDFFQTGTVHKWLERLKAIDEES